MPDLDLLFEVGESSGGQGGGNDIFGHVAPAVPQQGHQVSFLMGAFAQDGLAGTGADVGGAEIGAPVTEFFHGVPGGKLLQGCLQGGHQLVCHGGILLKKNEGGYTDSRQGNGITPSGLSGVVVVKRLASSRFYRSCPIESLRP
jgi:hypothetical protein